LAPRMAAWNAAPASRSARSSLATRSCSSSRLPTTAVRRLLKSCAPHLEGLSVRNRHVGEIRVFGLQEHRAIPHAITLHGKGPVQQREHDAAVDRHGRRPRYLDGQDVAALPLIERKARLAELLSGVASPLHYSDYHRGRGSAFHQQACKLELEGIVCKRADAAYAPGNRGHCTSFSIPIAICRRRIPVAPASRPTRSRLRPPATCRPSDPLHRGAARYFPRNSSMDVRCCGVRNDIVGAGQDCSRGPD
jgi:hypothetical protein